MSTINRIDTQAHDAQIIVGIKKNLQNAASLPLAAETFTPASLITFFQARIDAANAVATAKAQWLDAGKKYLGINTKGRVVAQGLKQYVMSAFGPASPLVADFGFVPPKRTPLTVEQKAAAVAKRAATRKARNTLGKKAKLAIKGTVPPTVPATPATLTAPSPSPPTPGATVPTVPHASVTTAASEVVSGKP